MSKKYLYVVMMQCFPAKKTEIIRETEKSYWDMNGHRWDKHSKNYNAFNTLEEANSFLINKKELTLKNVKDGIKMGYKILINHQKDLEKEIKELKKKKGDIMDKNTELMKGALLEKLEEISTSFKKIPNKRNNEVYDVKVFTVGDCEISIRNDSVEIVNQRIIRGFDFKDLKTIKVTPKSLIVEYFEIKRRKIIINREKRNN